MAKKRPRIPKPVSESVLKEFHHLCAVCGAVRPQLHHMDENPENNDPSNLIPLCPNHHLTDQHNPTRRIELGRLQLFRQYRDPLILSPLFQPLYRRLEFVLQMRREVADDPYATTDATQHSLPLVGFVKALNMGDYYGAEILNAIRDLPAHSYAMIRTEVPGHIGVNQGYVDKVQEVSGQIVQWCLEVIRYQGWPMPNTDSRNP